MARASILRTVDESDGYEPWAYEGRQLGEVRWLRREESRERLLWCGMWRCDPCTFDFVFFGDQTIHVVSGEATISLEGTTHRVEPGDLASFPQGAASVWTVHTPMRVAFVTCGWAAG